MSKSKSAAKGRVVREHSERAYGSKGTALLARKYLEPHEAIKHINKGLPFSELEHLRNEIDESLEAVAGQLSISRSTLQRRKIERRLSPEESDRLMRLWRLLRQAIDLFGNAERARAWLKHPQFGLGGAVPLDFAKTETGAREVENLLGRIKFSVYS